MDQPLGSVVVDVDAISPVAQDYLKTIWSATEWGDAPITGRALAERFGTTPANVSESLKRLGAQGLLVHAPYKSIELTSRGERYAIAMVRRHRLIEAFLVTSLGYAWDEVHDEAESLEHAASDRMIDRIDDLLGHPTHDPHGDTIPTRDGQVVGPSHAVRLGRATPGAYRIVRISDDDPHELTRFQALGLTPGATISVGPVEADRVQVSTSEQSVDLPSARAEAIWMVPNPIDCA